MTAMDNWYLQRYLKKNKTQCWSGSGRPSTLFSAVLGKIISANRRGPDIYSRNATETQLHLASFLTVGWHIPEWNTPRQGTATRLGCSPPAPGTGRGGLIPFGPSSTFRPNQCLTICILSGRLLSKKYFQFPNKNLQKCSGTFFGLGWVVLLGFF